MGTRFTTYSKETWVGVPSPHQLWFATNCTHFKFPDNKPMKLRGHIPECELYKLPMKDLANEECLMVYKNSVKTGVTIGRRNNVCSYSQCYFKGEDTMSKEWPIINCDKISEGFSRKGDSGSVVCNGRRRMPVGGLLTGGTRITDSSNITYATPMEFIMKVLHKTKSFKHAHLNSVLPPRGTLDLVRSKFSEISLRRCEIPK